MANPEHVEIVRKGAEAIRQAHLSTADLSGANLIRANLIGANLSGAMLGQANLSRADLRGTNLYGTYLRWADLAEANCSSAEFGGADLSGANLIRANLIGANLNRANLDGANLSGANLDRTSLNGADLSGANFGGANVGGANLHGANLREANLHGADLSRARFGWTYVVDVDLQPAKNLDKIIHDGPSFVSTDTLGRSHGAIPDAFLRGCGLSDWQISAARLHADGLAQDMVTTIGYELINTRNGQPIQFYSAFISYSHHDKPFARRLHDTLQDCGIRCWLDEHQLLPGDDIHEHVDRGIRLWDKVLLCASKSSLTSWWVDNEIESAFAKERQLMNERQKKVLALIPLDLDGYLFNWQNGKAAQVRSRLAADFTNESRFKREIDKLVKALQADERGRELPPIPKI